LQARHVAESPGPAVTNPKGGPEVLFGDDVQRHLPGGTPVDPVERVETTQSEVEEVVGEEAVDPDPG
jgi:hypothetical protein